MVEPVPVMMHTAGKGVLAVVRAVYAAALQVLPGVLTLAWRLTVLPDSTQAVNTAR